MPVNTKQQFIYDELTVEEGQRTLNDEGPGVRNGDGDGFLDGDGSIHDSKSNALCWIYDESSAAVLHAAGRTICEDWKAHFEDDLSNGRTSLRRTLEDREFHIHYTVIRPRVDTISLEREGCRREAAELLLELEAIRVETEEFQQETARIWHAKKQGRVRLAKEFRNAIAELHRELKEARSSDASSSQSTKRRHEPEDARDILAHGPSSTQLSKCRRVGSISVNSASDAESMDIPQPIARQLPQPRENGHNGTAAY